jgi:SM-20-related protein
MAGEDVSDEILASIEQHGYYIQRDMITHTDAAALRALMEIRYQNDQFKKAGVGRGASFVINEQIRKDSILWIETEPKEALVKSYLATITSLISLLNRYFFLPLKDIELMYAIYEKGSYYKKHRDRFEHHQHRFFTMVLYLTDWQLGDGGELVLYADNGSIKVNPIAGTFIIFRSEMEHEVLPAAARRFSITGWVIDVPIGLTFL